MTRHFVDSSADSIRAMARAAYQRGDASLLSEAVFEVTTFRRTAEARRLYEELSPLLAELQERIATAPDSDRGSEPSPEWLSGVQAIAHRFEVRHSPGPCCVYLILLRGPKSPDGFGVYVGETALTPEQRFRNHKRRHKANSDVFKYGTRLLEPMFDHLQSTSREDAKRIESELASALRLAVHWVAGGH